MSKLAKFTAAGAWLAVNWWILVAAAVLVAALILMSQIESCNSKKFERTTEEQKSEINQGKGEIKQIEEQRENEKQIIKQAESNSAAAADVVANVSNTDSGTREASRSAAVREWCKDHPADSKCQ